MTTHRILPAMFADSVVRFWHDEDGSQSIELMLMIPLYVWSFLATYVFFDAFRLQSINAKAGYTIGDIVSRQTSYITPEFIDSMWNLQALMIETGERARLRVSTIQNNVDQGLIVCWSETRGGGDDLTDARLQTMANALPEMFNNEIAILVQSSVDYNPVFAAGVAATTFDDFVVLSPRTTQVNFNTVNRPGSQTPATELNCGT